MLAKNSFCSSNVHDVKFLEHIHQNWPELRELYYDKTNLSKKYNDVTKKTWILCWFKNCWSKFIKILLEGYREITFRIHIDFFKTYMYLF
jgi:hypothetical protein